MKYTINPSCGHEFETQLYGKNSERERRIEWLERGVCPECYKAEQQAKRDKANAEAASKAADNNRPELTGSEKQVAWATTLRENAILIMEEHIESLESLAVAPGQEEMAKRLFDGGRKFIADMVAKNTEARYWIDNREWPYRASMENELAKIAERLLAE